MVPLLPLFRFIQPLSFIFHVMFVQSFFWGIMLMHCVSLHIYKGCRVRFIHIWACGGFGYFGPAEKGPWADLLVALAGPVMHAVQMGIWVGVYGILEKGDLSNFDQPVYLYDITNASPAEFFAVLSKQAYRVNLLLLIANSCLPTAEFDGGRILADLTIMCGASIHNAAFILSALALLIGSGLITWGVLALVRPPADTIGILCLLFGLLCLKSGFDLWGVVKDGRILEHPMFGRSCYRHLSNEDEDNHDIELEQAQP
jgi:Zn-dependent protease